jgi:hypothetical protein
LSYLMLQEMKWNTPLRSSKRTLRLAVGPDDSSGHHWLSLNQSEQKMLWGWGGLDISLRAK